MNKLLQKAVSFLKSADFIFYIVALAALSSMLVAARFELRPGAVAGDLRVGIAAIVADAVLILTPYWLCPRRLKGATVISLWLCGAIMTALLMYTRFSGDLPDLRLAFSSGSYNPLVLHCIPMVTRGTDAAVYGLPPLAATAAWLIIRRRLNHTCRPTRAVTVALPVFFWLGVNAMLTHAFANHILAATGRPCSFAEAFEQRKASHAASRLDIYCYNGPLGYLSNELHNMIRDASSTLSDEEMAAIDDYFRLRRRVEYLRPDSARTDSVFAANRGKNLILIVVESLNAAYIGRPTGSDNIDVTPVLSSLLADSGTVASLNVIPQAAEGRSSDGQMLIYSGILPRHRGIAAMLHGGNRFHALPEVLETAESVEIIGESKRVWNHRATNMAFGFSSIADYDDVAAAVPDIEEVGEDRAIFSYALRRLPSMHRPFLAVMTTVKMHEPYILTDRWRQPWIDEAYSGDDADLMERDYLQTLNYFDTALGEFLDGLQRTGLADESIVVIVSDHDAPARSGFRTGSNIFSPVAFIATGTGATRRLDVCPRGQADIFPTILEIMGRDSDTALGISMFNPTIRGAYDRYGNYHGSACATAAADSLLAGSRDIADMILRGDYFRHHDNQ